MTFAQGKVGICSCHMCHMLCCDVTCTQNVTATNIDKVFIAAHATDVLASKPLHLLPQCVKPCRQVNPRCSKCSWDGSCSACDGGFMLDRLKRVRALSGLRVLGRWRCRHPHAAHTRPRAVPHPRGC